MSLALYPPRPGRYRYWHLKGTHCGLAYNQTTGTGERAQAEIIKARVENELFQQSVLGPRAADHRFAEALAGYLEEMRRSRTPGAVTVHALLGAAKADGTATPCILSDFGHLNCRQVTQEAVDRVIRKRFGHVQGQTIQRKLITPVNAVLTWAARRQWCERPWLTHYPMPQGRDRSLDRPTAAALVRLAVPAVADILLFLMLSGARVGEAVKLDWADVDLGARWAVFRNTKRRTRGRAQGEDRGIPLHQALVPVLARLRLKTGGVGRVFHTSRGLPFAQTGGQEGNGFVHSWKKAKRLAALEGFDTEDLHIHDLRHTFATWMMEARTPQRVLDEIMGHATRTMGARYQHVRDEAAVAAIDGLPGLTPVDPAAAAKSA